jgi:hypothetical protein
MPNTPGTATGGGISPGSRTLNDFKNRISGGGARPNLFECEITFPDNLNLGFGGNDVEDTTRFLIKSAQLPASTINVIDIPFRGRNLKIAGDRTFADWSVTIINDEDFLIRNAMEEWSNRINSFEGNLRSFGSASPLLYKSDATVTQFSKTGVPIREYTFHGIYPADVSNIDLDWDATDSIEEFRVTFLYDYWDVTGGVTGNAGGS